MQDGEIDLDTFLTPRLRVMKILMAALVVSCLIFLGVVLALRRANNPQNNIVPLLTYMAVGFSLLMLVLHVVVPRLTIATARKQMARGDWPPSKVSGQYPVATEKKRGTGEAGKLCMLYQMQLIIGAAMLEGAVFFSLIAYLVEGDLASLAVAGLLIVFLLLRIPTRTGVENFLIEQGELLRQERETL